MQLLNSAERVLFHSNQVFKVAEMILVSISEGRSHLIVSLEPKLYRLRVHWPNLSIFLKLFFE